MSVVNLDKLEMSAPEVLVSCQHLLSWLENSGNGNVAVTEELRQAIQLLQEAGVQAIDFEQPTDEEIASILEADAESELDEAQGNIITDDMVWQELEEMISKHRSKSKRASA